MTNLLDDADADALAAGTMAAGTMAAGTMAAETMAPGVLAGGRDIDALPRATRAALLEVLIHGSLPRAEIARRLDLSRASLTRITRTLVDAGLLSEGETRLMAATGRPSELLSLVPSARHFLGVKLTGDTLYAVVTDLGANIVESVERPLPSREVADVVAEIADVAAGATARFPTLGSIGIAIAGRTRRGSRGAFIEVSAFLGWRDVELGALVTEATGLRCSVENDVQALTAAEHWFGAGAGLDSMALITIGTGLGCGLVVNDRLVDGGHARAGMMSHVIVDDGGPICGLGHRGCASSFLVNGSIVAALRRPEASYEDALDAARAGDPAALRAFADAGRALGVLVSTVANLVDPRKVVLTGDGIAVVEFGGDEMRRAIAERLDRDAVPVELDVRTWDFSEWARAGAALAIRALFV